jgi:uncharacterized tellurite resistance protein B-like protein
MIDEQFYRELGKFLYAIAMSDGRIQEAEVKKLEKIVRDELKTIKSGQLPPEDDEVLLTKLSFYTCIREHASTRKEAHSFLEFLEKNRHLVTNRQRLMAAKLIHAISSAGGLKPMESELIASAKNYLMNNK